MRIKHRGISLLEIMFAIGVAAIGLLGAIAVIPLALHRVGEGNTDDRASRAGLNAIEEFQVRGMADPDNWRLLITSPPAGYAPGFYAPYFPFPAAASEPMIFAGTPLDVSDAKFAFAIDPLFFGLPSNITAVGSRFPHSLASSTLPRMNRISLAAFPVAVSPQMSAFQSEFVFVLRDELVFTEQEDKTLPPAQVFAWDPGTDGVWGTSVDDDADGILDNESEAGWPGSDDTATLRQQEGAFSWMATLTPRLDERSPAVFNTSNDVYTLSVIVFENRDLDLSNPENERVVVVDTFYGDGTGGGELTLEAHPDAVSPISDLEVNDGDWVLLAGQLSIGGNNLFSWYRVDASENEVQDLSGVGTGPFQRDVTISGPDWPLNRINATFAVLLDNVVGVYQKTVRLELSSLWSG